MAGQVWGLAASGGFFGNPELSKDLIYQAQPIMRWVQFCDMEERFGQNMGDTLLFDKILNVQTQGGVFMEGSPFPRTSYKIAQGTCVAEQRGNSIDYSEKWERLSRFDVSDPNQRALINDMAKVRDRMCAAQFQATNVKYVPTGTVNEPTATWSSNGVAPTLATRALQMWDWKTINEAAKSGVYIGTQTTFTGSPIPPWDSEGNYVAVVSVGAGRVTRDDPDWEKPTLYADPDRWFNAEIGRIENMRFVEENNVLANTMGTSGQKGEAMFFGAETVKLISVLPPEMRKKIPLEYGTDRGVGWYSIEGVKLIWSFNAATEPDNRIIHLTSL